MTAEEEFDLMVAPKKKKSTTKCDRIPTEGKLQADAFKNLWTKREDLRKRLYTINNNSHNAIKGALNKAMGVVEGVADQCFMGRNGRSIYIEWKTPTGIQSTEQKEWQAMIEDLGYTYVLVTCESELLAVISIYE